MERITVNKKWVGGFVLVYMLAPCILFLLGWVREWIAYPAIALLLSGAVITWRKIPNAGRIISNIKGGGDIMVGSRRPPVFVCNGSYWP